MLTMDYVAQRQHFNQAVISRLFCGCCCLAFSLYRLRCAVLDADFRSVYERWLAENTASSANNVRLAQKHDKFDSDVKSKASCGILGQ
jgi:hypothetical protein